MKPTDEVHWITSRQLSPSPATKRNHSPASLSLQSSFSKDSSFLASSVVACLLNLSSGSLSLALAANGNEKRKGMGKIALAKLLQVGLAVGAKLLNRKNFYGKCGLGPCRHGWHFLFQKHRLFRGYICIYISVYLYYIVERLHLYINRWLGMRSGWLLECCWIGRKKHVWHYEIRCHQREPSEYRRNSKIHIHML